jgi:hypothetical protein
MIQSGSRDRCMNTSIFSTPHFPHFIVQDTRDLWRSQKRQYQVIQWKGTTFCTPLYNLHAHISISWIPSAIRFRDAGTRSVNTSKHFRICISCTTSGVLREMIIVMSLGTRNQEWQRWWSSSIICATVHIYEQVIAKWRTCKGRVWDSAFMWSTSCKSHYLTVVIDALHMLKQPSHNIIPTYFLGKVHLSRDQSGLVAKARTTFCLSNDGIMNTIPLEAGMLVCSHAVCVFLRMGLRLEPDGIFLALELVT